MDLKSFNLNSSANLVFKVLNKAYKLTIDIEQGYLHLYKLTPQPYGQYNEELEHVYDIIPLKQAEPIANSVTTEPTKKEEVKPKPKKRKKKK